MHFGGKKGRKALPASRRNPASGLKLVAVSPAEGGLVVHKPDGTQAIVPQSDDRSQNALLLGELVLEILDDPEQPCAQMGAGGDEESEAKQGYDYGPRPGEDPDAYVSRVGLEAAVRGARGFWGALQRMSGGRPR